MEGGERGEEGKEEGCLEHITYFDACSPYLMSGTVIELSAMLVAKITYTQRTHKMENIYLLLQIEETQHLPLSRNQRQKNLVLIIPGYS